MKTSLRQLCLPLAVLAAVGLSACGGSSGTTATPASSTPSPTTLSKAEFVAKMDAVCVDFNTRIQRLPQPSGAQDYANLTAAMQGTLTLFPQYIKQAEALVDRSADKATLTTNWLSVEKSDFTALQPALKKFIADVKAKNQAALAADGSALDKVPDHSDEIAGFMSGYGLKSCAIMERS
jgi:hypothetical protein